MQSQALSDLLNEFRKVIRDSLHNYIQQLTDYDKITPWENVASDKSTFWDKLSNYKNVTNSSLDIGFIYQFGNTYSILSKIQYDQG